MTYKWDKFRKISEEQVRSAYVDADRSLKDAAKVLGVNGKTLVRALDQYGIPRKIRGWNRKRTNKYPQLQIREWLAEQLKTKSYRDIAREVGSTEGNVCDFVNRHGLRSANPVADGKKKKFPDGMRGPQNGNWRGGRYAGGHHQRYIMVKAPGHPLASKHGYILEHRLVMGQHLGRYLERNEYVHHINGNGQDNRLENLQLVTKREHQRIHLASNNFQQSEIDRLREILDAHKITY
jgi:hypothetical protein